MPMHTSNWHGWANFCAFLKDKKYSEKKYRITSLYDIHANSNNQKHTRTLSTYQSIYLGRWININLST